MVIVYFIRSFSKLQAHYRLKMAMTHFKDVNEEFHYLVKGFGYTGCC